LEQVDLSTKDRSLALSEVLSEARPEDSLTLWHLLSRTEGPDRSSVFDRLAQLVPPPAGVTRTGILALDRAMLDLWWDQFGLGNATFWRQWERPWQSGK
jgi:hypothetical protein